MATQYEEYSSAALDLIKAALEVHTENGEPQDYEIVVNDIVAVKRTNDVNRFRAYEKLLSPETKSVSVILFHGTSNNNDKIIYTIPRGAVKPRNELNGIEGVEEIVNRRLAEEKKKAEHENLVKENESLKAEIKEITKEKEKLEKAILAIREKGFFGNLDLGKLASSALEGLIRNNPQWLAKLPGGQTLAGIIEEDNRERMESPSQPEVETEASFRKKQREDDLSEEQKMNIYFNALLHQHFTKGEISSINIILDHFRRNKENIQITLELLNTERYGNEKI